MSSSTTFDESRFRSQVSAALKQLQTILDNTRQPAYPADVPHVYDDKYGLAEFLTNTSIAAGHECLAQLGVTPATMAVLVSWARERSVTLRFDATEKCSYLRETSRQVESPSVVTESTMFGKSSTKVVQTVVEHFWRFESQWMLSAFVGTGSQEREKLSLLSREGQCEIMTSNKNNPRVEMRVLPHIDVRLTWLLSNTSPEMLPQFTIKRAEKACRTPRRNPQVEEALTFQRDMHTWATQVYEYVRNVLLPIHIGHGLDLNSINDSSLFVPVLALFEEGHKGAPIPNHLHAPAEEGPVPRVVPGAPEAAVVPASRSVVPAATPSALLPVGDANLFLSEQRRSIAAARAAQAKVFPSAQDGKLCSQVEAGLLLVCLHIGRLALAYADGVGYIEHLLRKQLIAAVGKELTAADFAAYMRFHQRKLYRAEYAPLPFSHAIRRPEHYPEGTVSIDSVGADGVSEPVPTLCRRVERVFPMHFALNAATNVTFRGQRFLHGLLQQSFGGASPASYTLTARARQFSSYILLAGVIGSADLFQPKHAILLQNKDELSIPLLLEQMPSAGAFRDAIASLSPEQQRFAKAVRAMQLEGSLFGLLLLQVKPQLEKLLRLPDDALTKEIRLTQDLMQLFTKYQIPSDLLSYDGEESAPVASKVARVRSHADKILSLVQGAKDEELVERQQEAQFAVANAVANSPSDFLSRGLREKSKESPRMPLGAVSGGRGGRGGGGRISNFSLKGNSSSALVEESAHSIQVESKESSRNRKSKSDERESSFQRLDKSKARSHAVTTSSSRGPSGGHAAASSSSAAAKVPQHGADDDFELVQHHQDDEDDDSEPLDWTTLPGALDAKLLELDEDAALRATTITCGPVWTKRHARSLLAEPTETSMYEADQTRAKNEAFDLLDALSRSGSLSFDSAELHIILACTHNFAQSLIDTVVQGNINPIERLERSTLLLAGTVFARGPSELIKAEHRDRVSTYSRGIFIDEAKHERLALGASHAAGEEAEQEVKSQLGSPYASNA